MNVRVMSTIIFALVGHWPRSSENHSLLVTRCLYDLVALLFTRRIVVKLPKVKRKLVATNVCYRPHI